MEVHFYLPERYLPEPARQDAWRAGKMTHLEERGKIASAQCWIFQTWLALERSGFPARLTHSIPAEGVMVTLTSCVPVGFRVPERVFFVGVVADYLAHPQAHLHVVQNVAHARRLHNSVFVPHWPHPNLLPRDPARSDRFENVCFLGEKSNLARELADPVWQKRLKSDLGVDFIICGADRWHDYTEADCVVAVRGFNRSAYLQKPATKLYNAWLAGVPFIGGTDSAYAAEGERGQNFLRAQTVEELVGHIRRLKNEPDLRNRLVAAGRIAGQAVTPSAILQHWTRLLGETVQGAAERWRRKSAAGRRFFQAAQTVGVWLDKRLRR